MREFFPGEVWASPRGTLYIVSEVHGIQATLKKYTNGNGRRIFRLKNRTQGWERIYDYSHGNKK